MIFSFYKKKLQRLVFNQDELKTFNEGLFNNIKNNLVIDEKITEIEFPTKPEIKLYIDLLNDSILCKLHFDYKGKEIDYFDDVSILRDSEYEKEIKDLFAIGEN